MVSFPRLSVSLVSSFLLQDRSQLRTLRVGMEKSNNMANSGGKVNHKGRPIMKPRGSVRSNRAVQTFDAHPKSHKHAQGIVHNGISRGHYAVFDTGAQQYIIGRDGWEIIKRHDTWIETKSVNMGGSSKAGRRLQLVDARSVVKNRLDGKRYLAILRKDFFNPN